MVPTVVVCFVSFFDVERRYQLRPINGMKETHRVDKGPFDVFFCGWAFERVDRVKSHGFLLSSRSCSIAVTPFS